MASKVRPQGTSTSVGVCVCSYMYVFIYYAVNGIFIIIYYTTIDIISDLL